MSETPNTSWIGTTKRIFSNTLRRLTAILLWLLFLSVVFSRLLNTCSEQSSHETLNPIDVSISGVTDTSTPEKIFSYPYTPSNNRLSRPQPVAIKKPVANAYHGVVYRYDTSKLHVQNQNDISNKKLASPNHAFKSGDLSSVLPAKTSDPNTADSDNAVKLAKGYYFGSIRRIENDNPLPEKLEPAYVDLLIDPSNTEEETLADLGGIRGGNTQHTIFTGAAYRKDNEGEILDSGVEYRSSTQTANNGNIRVNLVALNDDEDRFSSTSGIGNGRQQGLRRASIEQLSLPITENLLMDNILGTHRSNRYRFTGSNRSIVNQRFNITNPDIIGLTTRVRGENHAVTLSAGELGNLGGSFLTGFEGLDRDLYRLQYDYAANNIGFSSETWKTTGSEDNEENRSGSRINFATQFNDQYEIQTTLAQGGDGQAALFNFFSRGSNDQELGVYYFDPDFQWINTAIGNDSAGLYYRLQGRWFDSDISFNTEHRRDGLASDSSNKNRTHFGSLSINNRISRTTRASGFYSYRRNIDNNTSNNINNGIRNNDSTEHNVRAISVRQHDEETSSTFGANFRNRSVGDDSSNELQLHYDFRHRFQNDNEATIGLELGRSRHNDASNNKTVDDEASITMDLQARIRNNGTLSVGLNYDWERDEDASTSQHIGGYINYDWTISDQLSLNAQFDHNQTVVKTEQTDLSNTLFTATPVDVNEQRTRASSALLTLRYSFGGNNEPNILGISNGKVGSGSVNGRLFIDENNDGVAQNDEPGLQGIAIYLDSVFATITDSKGRFQFDRVTTGKHHIYLDESSLPLPWSIRNKEFYALEVRLRKKATLNIPVQRL